MEKRATADKLARVLCRELYEFTDGWAMEWRKPVGGAWMHRLHHPPLHRPPVCRVVDGTHQAKGKGLGLAGHRQYLVEGR